MKLAKTLTSVSLIALSALTLAACGNADNSSKDSSSKASSSKVVKKSSSSTKTTETAAKQTAGGALQDGTYNLEELDYSNGYKVKMSITVKDGKIADSTYDYINADGKSKTEDAAYEKSMKKVSGIGPKEYIPALRDALKKNGSNVGAIDVVSGATGSSLTFKNYLQQLVQAAQAGKTDTIKIANTAKLQDGTYSLAEKNDSHGYHTVFSITVAGGKITESNYDNVNADGKSKTQDEDYEKKMKDVNKVGPKEYTKALNDSLVKNQEVEKVDAVSGATSSSNAFVLYAEQLINAAQAGNQTKIEVDNLVYGE
ncbi:extracellular electron transfer flavoprotein PplA [Lacticaseibacillus daqingensis]|uniref:extracellular electron transfer flavoprotein PplA n=1 Tax=Lacticaseibacillus daqingensis TaxID=2486014 RepID=UPI000F7721F1|nr:extracellular electron transfer flavoprotein PplA [Lacticaseibacillus daqingensis]